MILAWVSEVHWDPELDQPIEAYSGEDVNRVRTLPAHRTVAGSPSDSPVPMFAAASGY